VTHALLAFPLRTRAELEAVGPHEIDAGSIRLGMADGDLDFVWGRPDGLGTVAYWIDQTKRAPLLRDLRAGRSLRDEVVFCLLGGHGITYAMNLAAYRAVEESGLLDLLHPPADRLEHVLSIPMTVSGRDRPARYRFPRQRALRLAAALEMLAAREPPRGALALREWLCHLPGVGPKTASWVVRNRMMADDIAVIDIHVRRAGLAAGYFRASWRLPRDYGLFELAFCAVARLGGVSAAALDHCVWDQLQALGADAELLIGPLAA
jgi:N-glycosylase/DNA lyase